MRPSSDEKYVVNSHVVISLLSSQYASKKTKNSFLRFIGYLNSINDLIKHVLLQIPVHAQPLNCLNCYLLALPLSNNTLLNTVMQFTKGMV